MNINYTDFCRDLFLLGSDLLEVEKNLSELRNGLLDLTENDRAGPKADLDELCRTITRVEREFIQTLQFLERKAAPEKNSENSKNSS